MEKLTSIQIHQNVKQELDRVKTEKESYEEAILKLIEKSEVQTKMQEKLMIEGCKEMAKESLQINKDWKSADAEWPE